MTALGGTIAPVSAWQECSLADTLVATWTTTLGVVRVEETLTHHPVRWRLWLHMPARPKAAPVVWARHIEDVAGERSVAFGDVEASLICAAVEEGVLDASSVIDVLRTRQTQLAESRVRPVRWGELCELAGVDPWERAARTRLSLGAVLSRLGLEAVRVEVWGGR